MTDIVIGRTVEGTDDLPPYYDSDPDETIVVKDIATKKMVISIAGTATQVTCLYAPLAVQVSNLGNSWEEVARDGGRTPLLLNSAKNLKKLSFSLFLGYQDWNTEVTDDLNSLIDIASSSVPVQIDYTTFESGLWRITSLSFTSSARSEVTQEITRADVDIEFTETSDLVVAIGPVTSGVKPPVTKPPKHPKTYKWKKGDTLQKIALRFYGHTSMWKKIASYNHIKHPSKIKPGRVIKLPN